MRRIPISALIGLFFTSLFFLSAIFADFIAPYGMAEVVSNSIWDPMSRDHLLGTDALGRDMLSRMIYGGQTTIYIATLATILSFSLGSVLGFTAATIGGWIDQALSRLVDLVMSVPSLILALVVLSVMPVSTTILILVMGILDSTRVFRLSRAVAVKAPAGSSSAKSCPMPFRRLWPNLACASSSRCSSSRPCRSSALVYSRLSPTGAAS
jgi:peptide/nickel transport system permease protein